VAWPPQSTLTCPHLPSIHSTNRWSPQALGIKPKSSSHAAGLQQPALEKAELDRLLKGAPEQQQEAAAAGDEGRIQGLGFKPG
jgi:hypothetical protein